MYQQIELVGSLGDDPDLRYTRDGTAVTSFRIETNRSWRAQDGTTREKRVCYGVAAAGGEVRPVFVAGAAGAGCRPDG